MRARLADALGIGMTTLPSPSSGAGCRYHHRAFMRSSLYAKPLGPRPRPKMGTHGALDAETLVSIPAYAIKRVQPNTTSIDASSHHKFSNWQIQWHATERVPPFVLCCLSVNIHIFCIAEKTCHASSAPAKVFSFTPLMWCGT